MKRGYSTILRSVVCLTLVASVAWADGKESETTPDEAVQANCELSGYKSEVANVTLTIPDNNATGVTSPPIVVPADGSTIDDVIIDFRAAHTFVGDIIATVGYDETCDGSVDATSTILCRQRGTLATFPAPCGTNTGFGAGGDLLANNTLLFDDTGATAVAEGANPTSIAAGCYRPSTAGTPLSRFEGLRKGGCWYLNVQDRAALDTGQVLQWSVHIKNRTVGVEESTWSQTKTLYR